MGFDRIFQWDIANSDDCNEIQDDMKKAGCFYNQMIVIFDLLFETSRMICEKSQACSTTIQWRCVLAEFGELSGLKVGLSYDVSYLQHTL